MTTQIKGGFIIDLPSDFVKTLAAEAEDEITIAENKWGVILDNDQRERVKFYAIKQLDNRVSRFSGSSWRVGDSELPVKIAEFAASKKIVRLPALKEADDQYPLTRIRDGIGLAKEDSENIFVSADLQEFLETLIKKWLRTGVYYGVGSYR